MADDAQEKQQRSPADKDRSRRQSRSVSGRDAARTTVGRTPRSGRGAAQRGQPGRGPKGPAAKGDAQRPGKAGRPTQRGGRPAPRAAQNAPRRPSTALLTWGTVAIVVVIVVVLVVVKLTGSSTSTSGNAPSPGPVSQSVLQAVTTVPASVFDTIGVTAPTTPVKPPTIQNGQPALTFDGKPGLLYMGGEFCPYCAAERWGLVVSLSRFGQLSGLQTMQSSSTDVFRDTQTFTFAKASFTSSYLSAKLIERYSNQKTAAGPYKILESLTKTEKAVVDKYDRSGSTQSAGSIPFIDVGNKAISVGASFSPSILEGLSRSQIAADLSDPKSPVTQAIITQSNYVSAAICSIDGSQPASVCTSKGVTAAAKALGLTS